LKLEKAIELTQNHLDLASENISSELETALKLLVEAGKRIDDFRRGYWITPGDTLPGETKEVSG